ncbi:anaerobic sulfatase maturase [Pasteurella multocida]|uniref:anaerobic sulfatase maturase n=1 Tax=Pasteurella multocida TaxID=747 RepID=UPI001EE16DAC|nr:anaerobic sulfatase maturase [Pasteurella multocida]MDX3889917.1 anaerobic sulfatase maturase [Pasteurella multocida]MDX3890879.1 anaerobic sulfatase maturase [Pasteurella multocida]MDX3897470.1 anaerobic sulfatase maturase [Pasteurella multocida]MDX3953773.1 anaerobic sulfatase maturase [Pasteurella multocida]MDX3955501.1 anaerobic sulfatase maturase [Pasteurella multocida]
MAFFSPKTNFHLMAKPSSFHCNIQCEYCFYLEKEHSFGSKAPFMSEQTLRNYVKNYIESHAGQRVEFAWQGGEPTLLGLDFFKRAVSFQQEFANGKTITNAFQTNGIALNRQWAAFFKQHQFLIGLSVDGLSAVHNRYRITSNGQPTFDRVVKALALLKEYQVDFNTLTVVNDQNWHKGKETYLALKALGSTFMQFIPIVEQHADHLQTFSVPSEGYGHFLVDVFNEWKKQDVGRIFVLEFDNLLGQWLGYPSSSCIHQPTCGKSLVVEANGDVYSCDHFVYPEYKIGNLNHASLAELVQSPKQSHFGFAKQGQLTQICRQCEFKSFCHGGGPKHRISSVEGEHFKHNYLCASYQYFFRQTAEDMQQMSNQIRFAKT